jgi:hypothetical protein
MWGFYAPPGAFLLPIAAPLPTPVRTLRPQVHHRRDPRLLRHVLARQCR